MAWLLSSPDLSAPIARQVSDEVLDAAAAFYLYTLGRAPGAFGLVPMDNEEQKRATLLSLAQLIGDISRGTVEVQARERAEVSWCLEHFVDIKKIVAPASL